MTRSCKKCTACSVEQSLDNFYKHGKYHSSKCKPCELAYKRSKYNSEKDCARHRRRIYGITEEQYNEMLQKQNGVCRFCKKSPEDNKQRLAVDHCHDTGKVRGLLCSTCNLGLGYFNDNIALLSEAILYLQEHVPDNLRLRN